MKILKLLGQENKQKKCQRESKQGRERIGVLSDLTSHALIIMPELQATYFSIHVLFNACYISGKLLFIKYNKNERILYSLFCG